MVAELTKCIRTNADCADICSATAAVLSRHTGYDANVTPHHHFRCRSCHELHDVELDNVEVSLRERGFLVQSAHVLLEGMCPRCAAEAR